MKKSTWIVVVAALLVLPTVASATFSVVQDSCRTELNTETTYFSVINFNSPVPICDLHFIPENPVPGCIMIGCNTPAGWTCQLNPVTGGTDYFALTPADCIQAGQIQRGFSFTLDPEFCCYLVQFTGPTGEVLHEQEECFTCVHVATENKTWGGTKQLFR